MAQDHLILKINLAIVAIGLNIEDIMKMDLSYLLLLYSNAFAALENNCLKRTCLQSPELKFRVKGSKGKKKSQVFSNNTK